MKKSIHICELEDLLYAAKLPDSEDSYVMDRVEQRFDDYNTFFAKQRLVKRATREGYAETRH